MLQIVFNSPSQANSKFVVTKWITINLIFIIYGNKITNLLQVQIPNLLQMKIPKIGELDAPKQSQPVCQVPH